MTRLRDALNAVNARFGIKPRKPFAGDEQWNGELEARMSKLKDVETVSYCEGCKRPECDHGCAYDGVPPPPDFIVGRALNSAKKGQPVQVTMTHGGGGGEGGLYPPTTPASIHEPIRPFGAPALRPTISDAYRNVSKDVANTIDRMLTTCEEARQEGLRLIEALNEAGEWHDDFQSNFAASAIAQATILRDTWKKQVDELHAKNAALKAAAARPPEEKRDDEDQ